MYRKIVLLIILAVLFLHCKKEEPRKERYPYLVEAHQVGKLKKGTKVCELDSVFASDSIVKRIGEGDYMFADEDQYLIYDSIGKHLLTLTPTEQHDIYANIETIRIMDARFKTVDDLSINSSFADIKKNYEISKIQNTFNNIVVFVDELNAYFTIDKKQLPEHIRFDMNTKIDTTTIPDTAKIKYYMLGWE